MKMSLRAKWIRIYYFFFLKKTDKKGNFFPSLLFFCETRFLLYHETQCFHCRKKAGGHNNFFFLAFSLLVNLFKFFEIRHFSIFDCFFFSFYFFTDLFAFSLCFPSTSFSIEKNGLVAIFTRDSLIHLTLYHITSFWFSFFIHKNLLCWRLFQFLKTLYYRR